MKSENEVDDDGNEMKTFDEIEEMTAMNYKNHRLAPAAMLEPTTAKYLLDFIYFTRDDEQFRFYKKVSKCPGGSLTGKAVEFVECQVKSSRNFLTFSR